MTRTLLGFLLTVGLCGTGWLYAGADGAGGWPQFRGPNADGISPEKGINKDWKAKPPKELWRAPLHDGGGNGGFAGPSVADGKVFIVDHQGDQDIVLAVGLADGKELWRFPYKEAAGYNYGFTRATPTVSGGKVYTLSPSGQLHCLDVRTGAKVWMVNIKSQFNGQKPQWEYAMSPVVDGDVLITCPGGANASVVALKKETGELAWKGGGSDAPGYSTPAIATLNKVKQYVVFTAAGVMGVDAAKGDKLWSVPWKTKYDVNAAMPVVIGESVFITSGYARGCALVDVTADGAKIRWENKLMQSHFNTPVLLGGLLYGTTERLVCLDPQTGAVKWQQPGFEKGGILSVDGALIVVDGQKGDVALVEANPAVYKELGRIKILKAGPFWAPPVFADGKLLVRDKTELVCLDLR